MFGNVLNGIPIIGHAKAAIHWLGKDTVNSKKAAFAASRTAVVMVCGAVGIGGGLPGIVACAVGVGLVIDFFVTVAEFSSLGFFGPITIYIIYSIVLSSMTSIKSVLKISLYVAADVLSGLCGAALADETESEVNGSMMEVAKPAFQMLAASLLARLVAENCEPLYSLPQQHGGSQPNQSNPTCPTSSSKPKRHDPQLEIFLNIFDAQYLADITIAGVPIFVNLNPRQEKSLNKLITRLRMNGYLLQVLETARYLLRDMNEQDVTFENFISLSQFVATYVGEQVASRIEAEQGGRSEKLLPYSYDARRQKYTDTAANEMLDPEDPQNIISAFKHLYAQVECFKYVPGFKNIFSAIYHYYKHRVVPEKGEVLPVTQYFGVIRSMVHKVRQANEFVELTIKMNGRQNLVLDRAFEVFGRRIRLVLTARNGVVEVSSCYFLDHIFERDKDGEEFIDVGRIKIE